MDLEKLFEEADHYKKMYKDALEAMRIVEEVQRIYQIFNIPVQWTMTTGTTNMAIPAKSDARYIVIEAEGMLIDERH